MHRYKKLSDEKLMESIQRSDTSAFDELYHRYSQRLLLYFFRELGGNEQKAQDFLQDIFLKIVEKPGLFDTERRFSTWIFTVAYNMCKNEYRRLEVREAFQNNVTADAASHDYEGEYQQAEQNVDQGRFEKAVLAELDEFDDGHRSAFLLRYQQNLSIREIGEVLGCSEGTIKSRLFYTTQKLARRLKAFNPYKTEVSTDEKIK
ncbi:MAG: sigma-70 family RNA polymerase sigma factor [Candidatus Zixiibacteriota bacterium]|nr:MAG: sigma-70 family RNA polymerase sigma factor [candidate division Zixibacteria bacterium]